VIAKIEQMYVVLFDQPIDGCAHIGPSMRNVPNLCWWHPEAGVMCDDCLVAHGLTHDIKQVTRQTCDGCGQRVNKKNKQDTDPWVATLRRTLRIYITDYNKTISLSRMGNASVVTTNYQGRTSIWCAHWACFKCRYRHIQQQLMKISQHHSEHGASAG
jgi:hypothetical protein